MSSKHDYVYHLFGKYIKENTTSKIPKSTNLYRQALICIVVPAIQVSACR